MNYLKEAARLLATLGGQVEREVYAVQVAEKGGVSKEAVLSEVARLRKARAREEKKRQNQSAASPTRSIQPPERELRYDNPRSARAEEGLIRLLYLDPSLSDEPALPPPESFSSPVLGRLYGALLRREREKQPVSLAVLSGEFDSAELSHFTRIIAEPEELSRGRQALRDYIEVIGLQRDSAEGEDLRVLAERLRNKQTKYNREKE